MVRLFSLTTKMVRNQKSDHKAVRNQESRHKKVRLLSLTCWRGINSLTTNRWDFRFLTVLWSDLISHHFVVRLKSLTNLWSDFFSHPYSGEKSDPWFYSVSHGQDGSNTFYFLSRGTQAAHGRALRLRCVGLGPLNRKTCSDILKSWFSWVQIVYNVQQWHSLTRRTTINKEYLKKTDAGTLPNLRCARAIRVAPP